MKQETLEEYAKRYSEEYFNRDEILMRCSKISFIDGYKLAQEQFKNKQDMKQTAVEWLENNLSYVTSGNMTMEYLIEQAKEMEKKQQGYSEEDMQSLIKIRNYFGENDKTCFEHFAYSFLDKIIEQFKNK